MRTASPLRYPGGKWRLSGFFADLITANGLRGCEYVEPYAGGGSLALTLLRKGFVSRVHLNDLAPAIYWVWWAMLNNTNRFIDFILRIPLTAEEWNRQRQIFMAGANADPFHFATAVFYLNRTNHSGILNGGMIGGRKQSGPWQMGARFNRENLVSRVRYISENSNRLHIYNSDAAVFIENQPFDAGSLVYLDPPYVSAGKALYLNSYLERDHRQIHALISRSPLNWVVSYDDVPLIRSIYTDHPNREFKIRHTARTSRVGSEVLFFSSNLTVPDTAPLRL